MISIKALISIVVPVYMVEKYLKECIDSIIGQTYKNIEIILIDDGSKDKSSEICDYYSEKDTRIKTFHRENKGLSASRNIGIEFSKGDYILFLDSDDFLSNQSVLSGMLSIIEKEKSDLLFGGAIAYYSIDKKKSINDLNNLVNNEVTLASEDFLLRCLKKSILYAPATFYMYNRKFLIKNKLYFKEGIYHEDEEFTPRALLKAKNISIYKMDFYSYRHRENSIVTTYIEKKGRDMLSTGVSTYNLSTNIKNSELKGLLCDLISSTMINQINKYKFKEITKEEKRIIYKSAVSKKFKIRAALINTNMKLYHFSENIYRKLRRIE